MMQEGYMDRDGLTRRRSVHFTEILKVFAMSMPIDPYVKRDTAWGALKVVEWQGDAHIAKIVSLWVECVKVVGEQKFEMKIEERSERTVVAKTDHEKQQVGPSDGGLRHQWLWSESQRRHRLHAPHCRDANIFR